MNESLKYIHAFNLVPGNSYKVLQRLYSKFGCFKKAWEKSTLLLLSKNGFSDYFVSNFLSIRSTLDLDSELVILEQNGIHLVDRLSSEYPESLKNISDSPFLIYRKGAPIHTLPSCISIVGSRIPSKYGEKLANLVAKKIAERGSIIVSGLAFGIDAIAHRAAVQQNSPTIAVLASGILHVTPSTHTSLANRIIESGGTLISEYASYDSAHKYRFLERNRIISGLSKATLVLDARKRSGALITAKHAFEQNRDVYSLIGDIDRIQSQGCIDLIKNDVARPILSIDSLMDDLGLSNQNVKVSPRYVEIIDILNKNPLSTHELFDNSDLSIQQINHLLGEMEVNGLIEKVAGRWVIKFC